MPTDLAQGRALTYAESAAALPHHDGWASALTGLGTPSHDKRLSHNYQSCLLTYEQLLDLYRSSDLAARAVESLPHECFRQGYELVIADEGQYEDLKEEVEAELARLEVDKFVERAMCVERGFGGSALLLGVNDGRSYDLPLVPERVSSIDWVSVLEPVELYPNTYYDDPFAAKYGEVETYRVTSLGVGAPGTAQDGRLPPPESAVIHETRLIVFNGVRVSRYQRQSSMLGVTWGDSMLVRLHDVLRDYDVAFASAGIIVTDFAQSVFHMDNLASLVTRDPAKIAARMAAIDLGRSTARAVLIDTKEKFERQTTSVAGLGELLDRLAQRLAAAIDMPLNLLMGIPPKGLGNEGESDVRFYYDKVGSHQRRVVGPILRKIVDLVMRVVGKKLPKKWTIRFNPLWQLSDQQKAEARLTQARADALYLKAGVVTEDEIRHSRFKGEYSFETQIEENAKAPGPPAPIPPAGAGVKPTAAPSGSHVVGGYARRNPIKKGAADPVKVGGDKTMENDASHLGKGDALEIALTRIRHDAASGDVAGLLAAIGELVAAASAPRQDRIQHSGGQYHVTSEDGSKPLGAYKTRRAALKRLRQVKYFKQHGHADSDGHPDPLAREFAGLPVMIESPRGSWRYWLDCDGTAGKTYMNYDYGFIEGAVGADGDEVDVYLGPDESVANAYVVHQMRAPDFAEYDEDKVMLGFQSAEAARAAYLSQYDDARFLGSIDTVPMDKFRAWIGEHQSVVGKYEPQLNDPHGLEDRMTSDGAVPTATP